MNGLDRGFETVPRQIHGIFFTLAATPPVRLK